MTTATGIVCPLGQTWGVTPVWRFLMLNFLFLFKLTKFKTVTDKKKFCNSFSKLMALGSCVPNLQSIGQTVRPVGQSQPIFK